jgi:hypothetical protein
MKILMFNSCNLSLLDNHYYTNLQKILFCHNPFANLLINVAFEKVGVRHANKDSSLMRVSRIFLSICVNPIKYSHVLVFNNFI